MTNNFRAAFLIALTSLCSLLSSCSSDPYKVIEDEKKANAVKAVSVSITNPIFQIVLDKDDYILNICPVKQPCDGASDLNNELIEMSRDGIGLTNYGRKVVDCGTGVGEFFQETNGLSGCRSKYYKVSNRYVGDRILIGLLSAGLGTAAMGTIHQKTFDINLLREAANNAHLHDLQAWIFKPGRELNFRDVISVTYIDVDKLDEAYDKIINSPISADGVVILDRATKLPLLALRFSDYKKNELPIAVNQQLSDLMFSQAGGAEGLGLDVTKLIPPEIPVPALPPVPQLSKSEYESKADFNDRVAKAVAEREEAIRKLQQEYKRDVFNRNQYIAALGESFQKYLDSQALAKNEFVKKLKSNQVQLAKLLYVLNLGKFTVKDVSYDAESKNLYMTATSARFGFKQKMLSKVPPTLAKLIKEKGSYSIKPVFVTEDEKVKMSGFALAETSTGGSFATSYTDINFKPESVSVRIASSSNAINKELSATLKSYEQKPQAIVDTSTKEVWYVETANRINGKIPDWFSTPEQSKNVIGYGVGNSHEEAMLSARKDLAYTVKTSISAEIDILQNDNTFRSYHDVTLHARAATDVTLKAGDYSVYKQSELDGKYYIALCFHCASNDQTMLDTKSAKK